MAGIRSGRLNRLPVGCATGIPDEPEMTISHETIYRSIYTSRRKLISKPMCKKLQTGQPIRKHKRHSAKGQWRLQIIAARSIGDRPADALLVR
ncbi:hypothetical protein [Nocardia anaemiae]|uniref:hypothetical protein n=1 Tax=Nocardia anaemiae TaxID=263910 RepID=UPI000ADC0934|nr:hypothetical protein [Nocardia anaemiae]